MPEVIKANNLYDYPKYYDVVFGSDWKDEFDFFQDVFKKHGPKKVTRLFEPACGTGRLLIKLAQAGFEVGGLDLNEKMIKYCNDRLEKGGFGRPCFVGDMADFKLKKKVDAAFNPINSFRHLPSEKAAEAHLNCVADCLVKGGVYILGLHLTPDDDEEWEGEEEWHAKRGNLSVISQLWTTGFDPKTRIETLTLSFDIRTPTKHYKIEGEEVYRSYTKKQMNALLKRVPAFELVETYDFCYDIDDPIKVTKSTQDVVYILKKV
ncbi:class I SAM-dependent methyltransferase [Calycomorphotria hydatis]|uniref:dTDP-3-amino-3,4, 6-trideoxy-alpha-D-glucopyranose n=1 Tax=Calycomorphotria hydatis TaxID=2528027 RepID=A0A517T5L1_9PLAN|nr:class I SAM-dependent methyltransferase [Calycomorphotria hydatis]QDT63663.1 dTDP-3-amino-3,4,6-trideoxy-alpha-D-glucopyranose [Calycomorphotria hydatis]